MSKYPDVLKTAREAGIYECWGVGFGCTLLSKHVMQQFPFKAQSNSNPCPDLYLAEKMQKAHLFSVANFSVPVKHWDGKKWLEPFNS